MPTLNPTWRPGERRRGRQQSDLQAKQMEAASPWPFAFPPDHGSRAGKWPHSRVCPREQARGQQEQTASREDGGGWGSSKHPLQAEMSRRQSSPWRGVRGHLPLCWEGSILQGSLVLRGFVG